MKLRVLKKPDGFFKPQYWDEEGKFPGWRECRLDDYLDVRYYNSLEEAQAVCLQYVDKVKKERGEIVWEKEM